MASQYVWIGIVIGVFFAGLGISYAALQSTTSMQMTPQQMQQMMNNPDQMAQWHQTIMNNPEAMNQWMKNPQHVKQMTELMKNNHNFMQEMMMQMINDPNIRLQMMGHMSENQESMNQMMGSNMTQNGMMMGNMAGMMQDNMMMQLMQDPETRKKMIELMKEHVSEMDELLSSNLTDDEFNMKMAELMQEHIQSMQDLMPSHQMTSMMERGDVAMGFNQTKIMHNFVSTATGGEIMIVALDESDAKTISEIRDHVKDIQHEFSQGNFNKPFFIHAQIVPGTQVMTEKKDLIQYSTKQIESGEVLVLTTDDTELLDAIKQFMDFQSSQHMGH